MEIKIMQEVRALASKQRDLFLFMAIMLAISNVILAYILSTREEKVILVPAVNKEAFWVSNSQFSENYLIAMSRLYTALILNVNPYVIRDYTDQLIRNVADEERPRFINMLRSKIDEFNKHPYSTSFEADLFEVNAKALKVVLKGTLNTFVNTTKVSEKKTFEISYKNNHGELQIIDFKQIEEIKNVSN